MTSLLLPKILLCKNPQMAAIYVPKRIFLGGGGGGGWFDRLVIYNWRGGGGGGGGGAKMKSAEKCVYGQ